MRRLLLCALLPALLGAGSAMSATRSKAAPAKKAKSGASRPAAASPRGGAKPVRPAAALPDPVRRTGASPAEAVALLKDYIRIDTTNPPGNELKSAQFLAELLKKEGIPAEIFVSTPGRANVLATLRAARPTQPPLLLLHHMDVVPAEAAAWEQPPFSGAEKDGYIWGRGALDTKTTGVLHLMALLRLKREGVPLNRNVHLLAVADEEAGGHWGAQWMVENHWDKMSPGFVIDEGGFGLKGVLTADQTTVYACAVAEKKVFWLRVTADGTSGHGSMPHSDNPNDILRRALARIELTFIRSGGRPPEIVKELERRLPRLRKSPLTEAIRHNTLAVTSLQSWSGDVQNPKINVIPARAQATLDCRLLPGENDEVLLEKLRRAVDDDQVTIEVVMRSLNRDPVNGYRSALYDALEASINKHDPGAVVTPFMMPAATDSRYFRGRGAVCYGLAPVVLNDEEYRLLHAANERVPAARLEKAMAIMYDWVRIFCEEKR